MGEAIVFPDAVAVVCTFLTEMLDERVEPRIPNPRPARFVVVQRVGGPRRNLVVDEALLTIEAWGINEADAHDLAQLARAWVNAMPGEVIDDATVYLVTEASGPQLLPDPLSGQPRYSFTTAVAMRGDAI